ncbi:unnamed protein product, partial [Didymodactylos carnosus]
MCNAYHHDHCERCYVPSPQPSGYVITSYPATQPTNQLTPLAYWSGVLDF